MFMILYDINVYVLLLSMRYNYMGCDMHVFWPVSINGANTPTAAVLVAAHTCRVFAIGP